MDVKETYMKKEICNQVWDDSCIQQWKAVGKEW